MFLLTRYRDSAEEHLARHYSWWKGSSLTLVEYTENIT